MPSLEMLVSIETLIPDFWFFPAFFFVFSITYILACYVIFRDWSPKHRPAAASCFISLVHGTPAAVLAASAILAQTERGFASGNTHFQSLVLDFSIAYFVVDLLHYLIFLPGDFLFIAHHLATLFVFVTCRYLVYHGAFALLVLLFLAEISSACQNIWTLAGIRKDESAMAARIYSSLAPPFLTLYTVARGFAGTAFFYQMSAFYLTGKASNVIPWWISLSWIVVVGGAIAVSILWVMNNWMELYRERYGTGDKKKR